MQRPIQPPPDWLDSVVPAQGQITLLTGPSGAGKSSLLRHMRRKMPGRFLDLDRLRLPRVPLTDCFPGVPLETCLQILARVGLGEAWSYLRTPSELSEGQRWRLKLAMALHRSPRKLIVADEFAALLDRVTAQIVSRCFRRWITESHTRAILATSHTDLLRALSPDIHVTCDFTNVTISRQTLNDSSRAEETPPRDTGVPPVIDASKLQSSPDIPNP